jgi:hypothetical protein
LLQLSTCYHMPSIPVDVLREILGHVVREADLLALCKVNKIFCSCSQNVLYREIYYGDERIIQTLARSTDLARRVRSFRPSYDCPELSMALRNMSSLRWLNLRSCSDVHVSVLDGCTFKLDSFACSFPYSESLQSFLNSQPSLTSLTLCKDYKPLTPFDERCLPNLTRVHALPSFLGILIPGRPVREVIMFISSNIDSTDWSFFTLSTTPIQRLFIHYDMLYPKPVSLLVSTFLSLVHLDVEACGMEWIVRVPLCLSI